MTEFLLMGRAVVMLGMGRAKALAFLGGISARLKEVPFQGLPGLKALL
jgi:hypothetical protein